MVRIQVKLSRAVLTLDYDEKVRIPFDDLLYDLEYKLIGSLLEENGGVKAKAADSLCLKRTTLVEKARKYGFPLKRRA